MRVCIITNYHSTANYGAVLQAYALNRVITQKGYDCETLDFSVETQNGGKLSRYMKRMKKQEWKGLAFDVKRDLGKLMIRRKIISRKKAIEYFKKEIPHTEFYNKEDLKYLDSQYDIFICGSDQIWRPTYEGNLVNTYWLSDISNKKVKVSYAASLGIDVLPDKLEAPARKYLMDFDKISVREMSAKNYFTKITGRDDIVTVLDPVFLLEEKVWDEIVTQPEMKESYILVYMIHGSQKMYQEITKFAEKENFKIVTFPYMSYSFRWKDVGFGNYRFFQSTPYEFLGLIKNAKYVITDSFHGTAFSIIFHKNFCASKANEKAISRITDLMKICGLEERIISTDGEELKSKRFQEDVNWDYVDVRLQKEIEFSNDFLDTILNIKK